MSIIEQALDKLDRMDTPQLNHVNTELYEFSVLDTHSTKTKSIKTIFVLTIVIAALTYITVNQAMIKNNAHLTNTSDSYSNSIETVKNNNLVDNTNLKIYETVEKNKKMPAVKGEITQHQAKLLSSILSTKYSWIGKGWTYLNDGFLINAVNHWENGFDKIDGSMEFYILEIQPYPNKISDLASPNPITNSSIYIRWPLFQGEKLARICIKTPNDKIFNKNNCKLNKPSSKTWEAKADLAYHLHQVIAAQTIPKNVPTNSPKTESMIKPVATVTTNSSDKQYDDQYSLLSLMSYVPQQIELGNYEEVLFLLHKYKNMIRDSWEYYYWQSQALIGVGELQQAEALLNVGLKKNPNQTLLWIQKGLIFQEQDKHKSAVDIFKTAELMDVKPANLFLNMGYSAAIIGDFALSKRAYRTYLSMTKNDPKVDSSIRRKLEAYLKNTK